MNQLTEVRTTTVIATEINSIKGQARAIFLHSSVEIGKRLIEAKELLPHGEWGPWLKENVDYSQSTANNLMQLYREYGSNSEALGNLSYTKAIALLGVSEEEREQFSKENDVENMSARDLQKIIKEKQKLEKQLEKKDMDAEKERKKLTKSIETLEKQLEKAQENQVDPAEVESLQKDLDESLKKVKKLEAELKAKPIETTAAEVVPESVEKELEELRKKVSEQGDPAVAKFKLRFETLVNDFKFLLEALNGILDTEEKTKYKHAVSGLIDKMQERL